MRESIGSNLTYKVELDDRKKKYIESLKNTDISDSSFQIYVNLMYKIRYWETQISQQRNIENFTFSEIIQLLSSAQSASENSITLLKNRIVNYLNFCKDSGWLYNQEDFISAINNIQVDKLINKNKYILKYVSEIDLYENIFKLINPQDKMFLLLVYNQIKGKKFIDLVNLEEKNWNDENSTLSYMDFYTNTEKIMYCNNVLAESIRETLKEKYYYFGNGNSESSNSIAKIIDSKYLLKQNSFVVKSDNKTGDLQFDTGYLRRRISYILNKYMNLNNGNVTVETLFVSGAFNNMTKYFLNNNIEPNRKDFTNYIKQNLHVKEQTAIKYWKDYLKVKDYFKDNLFDNQISIIKNK